MGSVGDTSRVPLRHDLPVIVEDKEVRASLAADHGRDLLQGQLDGAISGEQDGPPLLLGLFGRKLIRAGAS